MSELTLYELSSTYEKIMDMDLDEETVKEMLNSLDVSVKEKATNIAHVQRNIDAGINALKQEEKRLYKKRKALENRSDNIRAYLLENMKKMDIQKIKTDTDTIYISGGDYANITDIDNLPNEYKKQKIEIKVDQNKLNKDIKEKDIEGAEKYHREWVVIR